MYKMSKCFFFLFMLNYIWINRAYTVFPQWVSYIFLSGFIIFGVLATQNLNLHKGITIKFNRFAKQWLVFIIYALLTGFFVAIDFNTTFNRILFMVQVVVILIYAHYVLLKDYSMEFFYKVFAVTSVFYTVSLFNSGIFRGGAMRLYLSENSNPNSDAIVLAFGIYSLFKLIDYTVFWQTVSVYILSFAELYVIFLTGSRKGLILAVVFFMFGILKIWNIRNELNSKTRLSLYGIFLGAIAIVLFWVLPLYFQSSAYLRMQTADIGMMDRWLIIKDAMGVFIEYPLFGVGLNNYQFYGVFGQGLYAHSTIPELLSGTGIIGTVLYLLPYFYVIKVILTRTVSYTARLELRRLLICLIAVSTVMIIPYGMPLCDFSIVLFLEAEKAFHERGRNFNNKLLESRA